MSERGVFAMDRGWFDHPSFAPEPYTEREAWAWLCAEAAFKDRVRRVGKFTVNLKRGQLAASVRYLEERWQWKPGKVQRFLNRLKTDTMVATEALQGITVITICNYDKYQRVSLPSATQNDTPNDTQTLQHRYKTEDNKNTKVDDRAAAKKLTDEFFKAIGVDPTAPELDGFSGAEHYVVMWLERGIDRSLILATATEIAARAGPKKPLKYYATAIENAHATPRQPRPVLVSQGTVTNEKSVVTASDRFLERLGGREAAASYVPGSAGPRPGGVDSNPGKTGVQRISSG